MRKQIFWSAISLLVALSLVFPSCDDTEDNKDVSGEVVSGDGVKIGSILSVTGDLAGIGSDMLDGAKLAVKEINAAGGVLGQSLTLVNEDEGGTEAKARAGAQAHASAGIHAVVGAIGSSYTIAAAEVGKASQIVMVSPSSTSPTITDNDDDGYLFRTCPSDALQGALIAKRAAAQGATTASVIHVEGVYGTGLAGTFRTEFEATGGSVGYFEQYVTGQSSYNDILTAALASNPEVLVLVLYPVDGAQMIMDYNTAFSSQGPFIYLPDAVANQEFIDLAGGQNAFGFAHEGTAPSSEGPSHTAFAAAYQAEYGRAPGIYVSNAYDATYVLALAIEAAGSTDGAAIRDALPGISVGGTQYGPTQFADAVAAIKSGDDVDYLGASGQVDFDAHGDVIAPYAIWKVEGGAVNVISTETP